jgi:hypothetical protein
LSSTSLSKQSGDDLTLTKIERLRIVSLAEAEKLSSLSREALQAYHSDKIIQLGGRRLGMRLGDALMLSAKK